MKKTLISCLIVFSAVVAQGQTPDEIISWLPDIQGWTKPDAKEVFDPDNLFDRINGAAPLFIENGFQEMTTFDYKSGDDYITVQVYRHDTPENAFGMYASERSPDLTFYETGGEAHGDNESFFFFDGPLYVKIRSSKSSDEVGAGLKRIAEAIVSNSGFEAKYPEIFGYFPQENKIPHSEAFINSNFIGHEFLNNVYVCNYTDEADVPYQLFVIDAGSPEAAKEILNSYFTYTKQPLDFKEGLLTIKDKYNGDIPCLWKGNYMIGIYNENGDKIAKSEEILKNNSAMAQDTALSPYLNFLKTPPASAKDYILNLFQDYDIVIICERDHREITQYDLYLDIFSDKQFTEKVKNVYCEIGNVMYNDTLNRFLHNSSLNPQEVSAAALYMQRNIAGSGAWLWDKTNYLYYIQQLHKINKALPEEEKVSVFALDRGVKWETATENDIRQAKIMNSGDGRDSLMAVNFFRCFEQSKTNKALVIVNSRHAVLTDLLRVNTGRFIADKYKGKVANVLINTLSMKKSGKNVEITAVHQGKWDASFMKAKKKDAGFDFSGTPFGKDTVDVFPIPLDLTYSDVFKGFVYYNYFPDLRIVGNVENFIDDDFAPELMRRFRLVQKVTNEEIPNIDKLKSRYNNVTNESYREKMPEAVEIIERWLK